MCQVYIAEGENPGLRMYSKTSKNRLLDAKLSKIYTTCIYWVKQIQSVKI